MCLSSVPFQISAYTEDYFTNHNCVAEKDVDHKLSLLYPQISPKGVIYFSCIFQWGISSLSVHNQRYLCLTRVKFSFGRKIVPGPLSQYKKHCLLKLGLRKSIIIQQVELLLGWTLGELKGLFGRICNCLPSYCGFSSCAGIALNMVKLDRESGRKNIIKVSRCLVITAGLVMKLLFSSFSGKDILPPTRPKNQTLRIFSKSSNDHFIQKDNSTGHWSNPVATTRTTSINQKVCKHRVVITYFVFFCFSARDIKPVSPPVTPPLPSSPIPLFNPLEIQLGKKDLLLEEEQNSSSKQKGNPYRKSPNGRDK